MARSRNILMVAMSLWGGSGFAANYALLVGIDNYAPTTGVSSTTCCVNDATDIHAALLYDSSRWLSTNMTFFTNSLATKTAIRSAVSGMASKAVSGDMVLYYHTSHGGQRSGADTYIYTYDSKYEDEELAADLTAFSAGVRVFIILDTCYSGGMFKTPNSLGTGTPPAWDFAGHVMRKFGAARALQSGAGTLSADSIGWITACDYFEYAYIVTPYSAFSKYLVWGLCFADRNTDGMITYGELFEYAAPRAMFEFPGLQTPQATNVALLAATAIAAPVPADTNLQNGANNTGLTLFSPTQDAAWFRETSVTHDGTAALQSGAINDNETSVLGASVMGPGEISFWWCASCQDNSDYLVFYIDDIINEQATGNPSSWTKRSYKIGPGRHLLLWSYEKDGASKLYGDCGRVDQIVWSNEAGAVSAALGTTVNNEVLTFRAGGSAPWASQALFTHDGTNAAISGGSGTTGNLWTWLKTDVIGPGTLDFWWRVSCEERYDNLHFTLDDQEKLRISGDSGVWQRVTCDIGSGKHEVSWHYSRDAYSSYYSDCGYLDQVTWTGDCDTDNDGLPNRWEQAHGLNWTNAVGTNGAAGDPDGDGISNYREYLADTDPRDAQSFLQLTGIRLADAGGVRIDWLGGTGAYQIVECATSLAANAWRILVSTSPPTPATNVFVDSSATNPVLFYRIRAFR